MLDDIFWSDGMYRAWNECKKMMDFNLSLSMHGMGFYLKGTTSNKNKILI